MIKRIVIGCAVGVLLVVVFGLPSLRNADAKTYTEDELRAKSLEELLAIRDEMMGEQGRAEGSIRLPTLPSLVADSDLIVEGTVQAVNVDMDFIIECIVAGKVRALYGDLTLDVLESEPEIDEATISFPAAFSRESVSVGDHIFVPLLRVRNVYRPRGGLSYVARVVELEEQQVVTGLMRAPRRPTVSEAWDRIREAYDDVHDRVDEGEVDQWLDTLRNGTAMEGLVALERLAFKPGSLTADWLCSALEDQHGRLVSQIPSSDHDYGAARRHLGERLHEFHAFAKKAMDLLRQFADAEVAERILTLYLSDMSAFYVRVFEESDLQLDIFKILIHPDDGNRIGRVQRVLGQQVSYYDDGGSRQGGAQLLWTDYFVLRAIAETPGKDMKQLLESIYVDPDRYGVSNSLKMSAELKRELANAGKEAAARGHFTSNAAVLSEQMRRYRAGDTWFGLSIWFRAEEPTQELIDFLAVDERLENWTPLIAAKAGSPLLATKLAESIERNGPYRAALEALDACGGGEQAVQFARQTLEKPIAKSDLDAFEESLWQRSAALRYLGSAGHAGAAELIRSQLSSRIGDEIAAAHQLAYDRTYARTAQDRRRYLAYRSPRQNPSRNRLRNEALLALTKHRDPNVAKEWKQKLETRGMPDKAIAAAALFYLGDNAGRDFMEAFEKHEERIDRDYDRRLMTEGATTEVLETLLYLRAPHTDELLLSRLEKNLRYGDHDAFLNLAFVHDHRDRILALLLDHLESNTSTSRRDANYALTRFLRIEVEWDKGAPPGSQPEKVLAWRKHVESFLGQ